jgi:hypothetical protein
MRVVYFAIITTAGLASADGEPKLAAFRARIEAALAVEDHDARTEAVRALFYREGLDEWAEDLAARNARMIRGMRGRDITFEPLAPDTELLHVVDGYEYRPNLEPVGYVVFTDPAAEPGNNTKAIYGLPPGGDAYHLPLTVRTLVAPDAPPDKQLQMIVIGMAHPPATFHGWCDIRLSNGTVRRVALEDQGNGNQTRVMRGQAIDACEVVKTSPRGPLSLRLLEGDDTIFEERVETPEGRIRYPAPD